MLVVVIGVLGQDVMRVSFVWAGVLMVRIPDQEPHPFGPLAEIHEQVAGLLGRPRARQVSGDARQVHASDVGRRQPRCPSARPGPGRRLASGTRRQYVNYAIGRIAAKCGIPPAMRRRTREVPYRELKVSWPY